jgi:hypothetical protein
MIAEHLTPGVEPSQPVPGGRVVTRVGSSVTGPSQRALRRVLARAASPTGASALHTRRPDPARVPADFSLRLPAQPYNPQYRFAP